ncbi:unnamed protein product [Danaus chrysippus]|uniref:(African queen) hypothetical protein n=1 Tax=Danaus chrysippus TaxID=151541 RepID=A0A8J2QIB5_9NEOP|nr:unnamed protein product [Danaus chrysippus]
MYIYNNWLRPWSRRRALLVTKAYQLRDGSERIIIYLEKWQRAPSPAHPQPAPPHPPTPACTPRTPATRAALPGLPFAFALRYTLTRQELQLVACVQRSRRGAGPAGRGERGGIKREWEGEARLGYREEF